MPGKPKKRKNTDSDDSDIVNPLSDSDEFDLSDDSLDDAQRQRVSENMDLIMIDVRAAAERTAAEKAARSTSPSDSEEEDEVAVNYSAALIKGQEREKREQEEKEAEEQEKERLEAEKLRRRTTDATLSECENAGIQMFLYGLKEIGIEPSHELLQIIKGHHMRPSQVLPKDGVELKLSSEDIQWLLVKIARETVNDDRKALMATLIKSSPQLDRSQVDRVLEAVGFRYWDKHKGFLKDKASAYSVLNMERNRAESKPQVLSSSPELRYRSSESFSDFFDTLAMLISPECTEFLMRVLLLASTDSSLESLQSDTSPVYSAMARILERDYSIIQAVELACDIVDLKSARTRFLQVVSCGLNEIMNEYAKTCCDVFFLKEYMPDKSIAELAELGSTDKTIITNVFFEHLNDFSSKSDKSSSFIRHMFKFFQRAMHLPSALDWTPDELNSINLAFKSRADLACDLNNFKFIGMATTWSEVLSRERARVDLANSQAALFNS